VTGYSLPAPGNLPNRKDTPLTEPILNDGKVPPCPGCGGAITDILVHVPRVQHHRPIEDGGWEVWTDQGPDDVSLTYIVRCSNTATGHAYSDKDVPEAVTTIVDTASRITDTVNRITGTRRTA
jgi:hypothetical protein